MYIADQFHICNNENGQAIRYPSVQRLGKKSFLSESRDKLRKNQV